MKKFIITALTLGLFFGSVVAQTVQGTIKDVSGTTPNTVTVYAKPSGSVAGQISNINLVFSILDQGAANPTDAQIAKVFGVGLNLKIDNGTGPSAIVNPVVQGGRAYYTYLLFQDLGTDAPVSWTAGVEYPIISFTFPNTNGFGAMRLDDLSNTAGGPNGQMTWYFQVTGPGDLTNYNDPFYGTGAVNNAGAAEQFVPLQTLLVNFTRFSATKNNNNALLQWNVDNEGPITARYEVERSLNARNFTKIATVQPKNNGRTSNVYDLTDFDLKSIRMSGSIYYRIKQYDLDGQFVTTETRSVRVDGSPMTIFPNPVKNSTNLTFELANNADVAIMIIDAAGQQVKQIQVKGVKGTNVETINMSSLASGTYLIKVQIGTDIQTLSVVK